ncbi:tetratricopeptide repeat protein [Pseudohongiella sp.]|uniref:Tetratricopeptide repeat protein n=1 Tax=marine sediment metagenome TaxID=412755 RepID=A0A0F9YE70_9ZZZZ|nr:tetratricopeptide repeat protein [Pseudohongiella sp.]HDZ09740.1 tetratricopeptide repeat protein [Pseudohongiella sp.]HEA61646.1 tetratricopeptide repeat protein [Pseudohongiella sp.]
MLKMKFKYKSLLLAMTFAASTLVGQAAFIATASAQEEDDGPRQPPPTRSSQVLSDRVFRVISEVNELMNPTEEGDQPDLPRAKRELDELNERYDSLNDFEKSTLLNFYTNYYMSTDDIDNALLTFERILTIEELREDARLRALRSLGQLYASEERFEEAIDILNQWRELSAEEDATIYLILAQSHYYLENYEEAIPLLISHMDLVSASGGELRKNIYGLLNVMYIELEDYRNALEVTRTMIALFDEAPEYRNLAAIYGFLEDDAKRLQTLELTYVRGYMDSEAQYLTLAQSLAGIDAPYRGIEVMEDGIEKDIVEESESNLRRLTQMYIMASEFEGAVEPAERLTELANDGESWDYLGYIHLMNRDYESAVEAMQTALQRGGLENQGDVQLSLARALVELDRFDDAAAAARAAQNLGVDNARQFLTYIENSKARYETLQQRKEESIEYYREA